MRSRRLPRERPTAKHVGSGTAKRLSIRRREQARFGPSRSRGRVAKRGNRRCERCGGGWRGSGVVWKVNAAWLEVERSGPRDSGALIASRAANRGGGRPKTPRGMWNEIRG